MSERIVCWIRDNLGEDNDPLYVEVLALDEFLELHIVDQEEDGFAVFLVEIGLCDDCAGPLDPAMLRLPMGFAALSEAKTYAEEIATTLYRSTSYLGCLDVPDGLCNHVHDEFSCQLGQDHMGYHEHGLDNNLLLQWLGQTTRLHRKHTD